MPKKYLYSEFFGSYFLVFRPCQSLFFNKVAGLTLATLLKKSLWNSPNAGKCGQEKL